MGHERDLFSRHKSGREFPIEISLNPIKTPRRIIVLPSVIDITERKTQEEQLESALKEKELLYYWRKFIIELRIICRLLKACSVYYPIQYLVRQQILY